MKVLLEMRNFGKETCPTANLSKPRSTVYSQVSSIRCFDLRRLKVPSPLPLSRERERGKQNFGWRTGATKYRISFLKSRARESRETRDFTPRPYARPIQARERLAGIRGIAADLVTTHSVSEPHSSARSHPSQEGNQAYAEFRRAGGIPRIPVAAEIGLARAIDINHDSIYSGKS